MYTSSTDQTIFNLQPEDIFVRLPSADRFYQSTIAAPGPFFDGGLIGFTSPRPEELGSASHIILVSAILGDVLTQTQRSTNRRSLATYPQDYASFYAITIRRLGDWESTLPPYLHQTQENTMLHITRGDLATYLSIHTVYHTTAIYLHRYCRHALLPADVLRRNIQQATAHAVALLDLFNAVVHAPPFPDFSATSVHSQSSQHGHPPQEGTRENPLTNPLLAHAALVASDVLSCAGTVDRHLPAVLHLLHSAQRITIELSRWLGSARACDAEIAKRIGQFRGMRPTATWRMDRALGVMGDVQVGGMLAAKEFDVFYGIEEWTLQKTRGDFVVGGES